MSHEHLHTLMARRFLVAIGAIWLIVAALAFAMPAPAQTSDSHKPRTTSKLVHTVPYQGLYIDQTAPQRYCALLRGVFGAFGEQWVVFCGLGWGSGGSAVVQITGSWLGAELPLYRLQYDNGLLQPVVLSSVTVTAIEQDSITVRFGSPGAQTLPYTMTRQPCCVAPLPYLGISAPWGRDG